MACLDRERDASIYDDDGTKEGLSRNDPSLRKNCINFEHRVWIGSTTELIKSLCMYVNSRGHSIDDLQMLPFERVRPANNPNTRKIREKFWINRYEAIQYGENKQKSS